jgi:hypothetical protein
MNNKTTGVTEGKFFFTVLVFPVPAPASILIKVRRDVNPQRHPVFFHLPGPNKLYSESDIKWAQYWYVMFQFMQILVFIHLDLLITNLFIGLSTAFVDKFVVG